MPLVRRLRISRKEKKLASSKRYSGEISNIGRLEVFTSVKCLSFFLISMFYKVAFHANNVVFVQSFTPCFKSVSSCMVALEISL